MCFQLKQSAVFVEIFLKIGENRQVRNSLSIIDTETKKLIKEIAVGTDPNWIDFTNDGKYGIVSNTGSNTISIIDLQKNEVVKTIPVGLAPKRLKVAMIKNY